VSFLGIFPTNMLIITVVEKSDYREVDANMVIVPDFLYASLKIKPNHKGTKITK